MGEGLRSRVYWVKEVVLGALFLRRHSSYIYTGFYPISVNLKRMALLPCLQPQCGWVPKLGFCLVAPAKIESDAVTLFGI